MPCTTHEHPPGRHRRLEAGVPATAGAGRALDPGLAADDLNHARPSASHVYPDRRGLVDRLFEPPHLGGITSSSADNSTQLQCKL